MTDDQKQQFYAKVMIASDQFIRRCEALDDLIDSILPVVETHDSLDRGAAELVSALRFVPLEDRVRFSQFWVEYMTNSGDHIEFSEMLGAIFEEFKSESYLPKLIAAMHDLLLRPKRKKLMLEQFVISAVSSFEVLFAALVKEFYKVSPQALENVARETEKEFSLKDLKALENIEDAVDLAITRRIDDLMFKSFSEWRKFFSDRTNIKFEECAIDWERLKEVFQRRHILVHNGGIVSKRYISNVNSSLAGSLKAGDEVSCDEEYAHRAVAEVMAFGFLLSSSLLLKFGKDFAEWTASRANDFAYSNLLAERNSVVGKVTEFVGTMNVPMGSKLTAKVNNWIARERMSPDSTRAEISSWDVSALGDRYRLAKLCLQGEKHEALKLVKVLYRAGELSAEDIIEWPLFEPFQKSAEYKELLTGVELPVDLNWSQHATSLLVNKKTGVVHLDSCRLKSGSWVPVPFREASKYRRCKTCGPIALAK
ncbi:hypothetical protein [Streptomyces seoulensis]|uniref:hypothetical protein n=1 Tax=Streptomyces seoulensis TaxID=73044 RepID=UPI001FCC9841|nr:hypothetical protein [Streptomyces seoulensis]